MAFWSPVSHLVTFGATGIQCGEVCSACWVLSCAIGAVLGGCRWCVTITIVTGVGCLALLMADCIPQVWSCGRLVLGHAEWQSGSASSQEGLLNGFFIGFPRSFPLWQYAWMMQQCSSCLQCSSLIILQWSISVLMHATRSWGFSPGLATTSSSSPRCTWVLMSSGHSLLYSVEEGRSFCLGHSLFLFAACRHPLCMHLQGFGSQGCKNILQVVLTVRW